MKTLLIIDPQNDFCDIPDSLSLGVKPQLPVPGSHEDMLRLSSYLDSHGHDFDNIIITLDSHNAFDIAHSDFWVNEKGESPAPFTLISLEDVKNGVWKAKSKEYSEDYINFYLTELEKQNKYKLIIWPTHCVVGSWGHNIHSEVLSSLVNWSKSNNKAIEYVFKGLNPATEHYSAIKAEVVLDSHTEKNLSLLNMLSSSNEVYVAGEAFSHCVASTVLDIIDHFEENNIQTKLTILENCSSSVSGFENESKKIKETMTSKKISFLNV